MLEATSLFQNILISGIFAEVPNGPVENAMRVVTALLKGGVRIIEVDIRSSEGMRIIEESASRFKSQLIVSANFVRDTTVARRAILAGAEVVSTPYLVEDVIKTCNRYGKICIPGALTVTEVLAALEMGATLIKLYPAGLFGPGLLKAVKGPLPQANLIPAAGVNMKNMAAWLRAGACAVVIDGIFRGCAPNDTVASYETITTFVRQMVQSFEDNTSCVQRPALNQT